MKPISKMHSVVYAAVWVKGREFRFRDVPGMLACYQAQMAG